MKVQIIFGTLFLANCNGFLHPTSSSNHVKSFSTSKTCLFSINHEEKSNENNRRAFLSKIATSTFLTTSAMCLPFSVPAAMAGIDPSALKNFSVEGDTTGSATRLRQIEEERNRPSDAVDAPFTQLTSGVSFREYREGKGEAGKKINFRRFS